MECQPIRDIFSFCQPSLMGQHLEGLGQATAFSIHNRRRMIALPQPSSRTRLTAMHRRFTSRFLLSLLMLWQLSVGAFAHPLHVSLPAEQAVTESCHESASTNQQKHDAVTDESHTSSTHDDQCKVVCKCPCAGAIALTTTLYTTTVI